MSVYRNSRKSVAELFKENHGQMVKIYNLCAEADFKYDQADIGDFSMFEFPFKDHNVTGLQRIFSFCLDAALYLQRMEQHH